MRVVLQNVISASVKSDGMMLGSIGRGYLLFLGIGKGDTKETADKMIEKIIKLRVFRDSGGKTNLSISDVDGSVLVVSQFTLYADCKKGNRPSFTDAAPPAEAKALYEYFLKRCNEVFPSVSYGEFGADMQVELVNDGPFTLVLDSDVLFN